MFLRRILFVCLAIFLSSLFLEKAKSFAQEKSKDDGRVLYKREIESEKVGLIKSLDDQQPIIDIGKDVYVTAGMEFKVYRQEERITIPLAGETMIVKQDYKGRIKVIEAKDDFSRCKILHVEPTDKLFAGDKVISIPGTGYEELLHLQELNSKAARVFLQAKAASRHNKDSAIKLYNKVVKDFTESKYASLASNEIERYERVLNNSPYFLQNTFNLATQSSTASSSSSKDIAVDSQGNTWLLNSKKQRLEKYDPEGKFQLIAENKDSNGKQIIKRPVSITLDHADNIYLLDAELRAVVKFDAQGKLVRYYGPLDKKKTLEKPVDLAINSRGEVFILDAKSRCVYAYTPDNHFWTNFGQIGSGDGEFVEPVAIAVDNGDNIYVLDKERHDIQIFSSSVRFKRKIIEKGDWQPVDMSVFANSIYVLEANKCSIIKFDISSGEVRDRFGAKGSGHGKFSDPTGIDTDEKGNIYVADGRSYSIQKFSPEGAFLGKLKDEQISKAIALACDSADSLYILDNKNNNYQKLNKYGWSVNIVELRSEEEDKPRNYSDCQEIASDFEGNIYVLDGKNYKIQKFSSAGEFIFSFGSKKMFTEPVDFCIDREGNIYVLDAKNYIVKKFDSRGNYVKSFGEPKRRSYGEEIGQFKKPTKITVDSEENIYVLDEKNKEVYKFDCRTGDFIAKFGETEARHSRLIDIAADGLGCIYVAERQEGVIYKYQGQDGSLLTEIKMNSDGKKSKKIISLAVNGAGSVFVLDDPAQIWDFEQ